ncbi:MAG: DegT/DnrJ/EryC1/StrS family aminotransferase, partial [Thaumarchaeota archaeon]
KLDKLIEMRRNNAKFLSDRLQKFKEIQTPNEPSGYKHIYQMYTIRLSNSILRDKLHKFLIDKRIFSKVYFNPIHKTEFYQQKSSSQNNSLHITEKIANEVLTIPLYPNMTNEEKNYLIDAFNEFFEKIN